MLHLAPIFDIVDAFAAIPKGEVVDGTWSFLESSHAVVPVFDVVTAASVAGIIGFRHTRVTGTLTIAVSTGVLATCALGKGAQISKTDATEVEDGERLALGRILGVPADDAHFPAHGTRVFDLGCERPAVVGCPVETRPAALSIWTSAAAFGPACEQGVRGGPSVGWYRHLKLVDRLAAAHAHHVLLSASRTGLIPVGSAVQPAAAEVVLLLAPVPADVASMSEPSGEALAKVRLVLEDSVTDSARVALVYRTMESGSKLASGDDLLFLQGWVVGKKNWGQPFFGL